MSDTDPTAEEAPATEPAPEDLTKAELQEELAEKGLPTSGNKADLVARLEEADGGSGDEAEEEAEVVPNPSTAPEDMQPPIPGPDGVIESEPVEDAPGPEAAAPAAGGGGESRG